MNLYEEVEKIKASGYSEQKLNPALPAGAVFCQNGLNSHVFHILPYSLTHNKPI